MEPRKSSNYSADDALPGKSTVILHVRVYTQNKNIIDAFIDETKFGRDLENSLSHYKTLFNFSNMEINKFWETYYGVVNLSSISLSDEDLKILGRGLKFCPTPQCMPTDL